MKKYVSPENKAFPPLQFLNEMMRKREPVVMFEK